MQKYGDTGNSRYKGLEEGRGSVTGELPREGEVERLAEVSR